MALEWLAALAGGGDIISKKMEQAYGVFQDWRNYNASRSDTEWSKKLALWNAYQQQREFDYARDIQNQIFEREDNSVQRRVADLEKAGLSKTLAAGSGAGAGSVVSTHLQNVGNPTSHVGGQSVSFQTNFLDMLKSVEEIKGIKEQIEVAKAQKNRINADTASVELDTKMKQWDFDHTQKGNGMNKSHGQLLDLYYILNNFLQDHAVEPVSNFVDSTVDKVKKGYQNYVETVDNGLKKGKSALQSFREHFPKAYIEDGALVIEEPRKKWFNNRK